MPVFNVKVFYGHRRNECDVEAPTARKALEKAVEAYSALNDGDPTGFTVRPAREFEDGRD